MFNLPNFLSFLRLPLAALLLFPQTWVRATAILLALITDGLDGYLARKNGSTTYLGALLDPFTDKFFVLVLLTILFQENQLELWQIAALLSRDIALICFGAYLLLLKQFGSYKVHAIWCGKVSTCLQLGVLFAAVFGLSFPEYGYSLFIFLGISELFLRFRNRAVIF